MAGNCSIDRALEFDVRSVHHLVLPTEISAVEGFKRPKVPPESFVDVLGLPFPLALSLELPVQSFVHETLGPTLELNSQLEKGVGEGPRVIGTPVPRLRVDTVVG